MTGLVAYRIFDEVKTRQIGILPYLREVFPD